MRRVVARVLASPRVRRVLRRLVRLAQELDLSSPLVRSVDLEASEERVRILRGRGMKVGGRTLIGRARFDAHGEFMEIGERCAILDDCVVIAHDINGLIFGELHRTKVRILDNSVLMPGVYVLPGVTIGPNAVVAPRSVVAQDIPPNTYASGHPARPVCSLQEWLADVRQHLQEDPSAFTALPSEGGFRDELLRAWDEVLKEESSAGPLRDRGAVG